jgi:hypothetical protein
MILGIALSTLGGAFSVGMLLATLKKIFVSS